MVEDDVVGEDEDAAGGGIAEVVAPPRVAASLPVTFGVRDGVSDQRPHGIVIGGWIRSCV